MSTDQIRVLLVDDQALFVQSLKKVIESDDKDILVVGIATNGKEAIEKAAQLQPDVVLMDIRMPLINGVEATRELHHRFPAVAIVVLTTYDDDEYIHDALAYGAIGYLLKDIPPDELIRAIKSAHHGTVLLSAAVASRLVTGEVATSASNESKGQPSWFKTLSRSERKILHLLYLGKENKEIALELNLAVQTVKNHVASIYKKIGIHSREELTETREPLHESPVAGSDSTPD